MTELFITRFDHSLYIVIFSSCTMWSQRRLTRERLIAHAQHLLAYRLAFPSHDLP